MPNFIDIEASGLHFDSYPIEIALLVDGEIHSWLSRPEVKWTYWSEEAQAMHGLSRAMLHEQGLPVAQVAREMNQVLADSGGLVYSDAVAWDEDWVNTLFHACGEQRHFHLLPVQDLLTNDEQHLFEQALLHLQASGHYRRHRAAQDVALLHAAYLQAVGDVA